jgi:hypothetical protein
MRGQLLTTAPLAIIAVCYAIAAPSSSSTSPHDNSDRRSSALTLCPRSNSLNAACRSAADNLSQQLPAEWNVLVREPFVIAGDCRADELGRYHQQIISPTARALAVQYFDAHPNWPITVVLCSSDESYKECNQSLGERERSDYAGIYSRHEHRVIVNMGTGEGTLAHEMTHALAHADFPTLPEWLDEGLASLYEECEFSDDGLRLLGSENWRGAVLLNALRAGKLRSIADLASQRFAEGDPSTDYAQARYFCLYLQQRGLLEPFYRKTRARAKEDLSGLQSLCDLMETDQIEAIDRDFQKWFGSLRSRSR